MERKTYKSMVAALSGKVKELFPWEFLEISRSGPAPLLLDIRCPNEFDKFRIQDSINVPRGILEIACDYGYEETVPELVEARDRPILVICRSGSRSILAARTLELMGYGNVASLRTGLRGWNDYELALYNNQGKWLDPDRVEAMLSPLLSPEQLGPPERAVA
jgi:rhodanese-related sulfurtransferase